MNQMYFFQVKKIKRRLKKTQGKAISANLLHVRKVSDGFEKVSGDLGKVSDDLG